MNPTFTKSTFFLTLLAIFLGINILQAQNPKKQTTAVRTTTEPLLDGKLDDLVWKDAPATGDFVQIWPENGKPARQKTEVKILYDNKALYVGAMLYDTAPDSIADILTKRDNFDEFDYFGVAIDPYNNALGGFEFFVTPANVQFDLKASSGEYDSEDISWDAVYESAVNLSDEGWSLEMKIPYSAIRFPKTDVQTWGLNMFRKIARYNSNNSWSHIDNKQKGFIRFQGELLGISNVEPPLRLSFTPYFSTYFQNNSETNQWGRSIKGGLDLKYGINESTTLDLILIPDFGQVQSDDIELNLTPFELYYSEKRPFFMEGTELFNRAGIFYSRRIGSQPVRYSDVKDNLQDHESMVNNPLEAQLVNATKLTGRTKNGYGYGMLNAITKNTYAEIRDNESGETRRELTQPFTNYNVGVVEKSLKNNSYVSLINANYARFADNYYSNVTATEFRINNKSNTYSFLGKAGVSQRYENNGSDEFAGAYTVKLEKTSGKYRFNASHDLIPKDFRIDDMGYMQKTNFIRNSVQGQYINNDPKGKLLNRYHSITLEHYAMHSPSSFNQFTISGMSEVTWKNNWFTCLGTTIAPVKEQDYYETRTDNRFYLRPQKFSFSFFGSTNRSKRLLVQTNSYYTFSSKYHHNAFNFSVNPRLRISSRFSINYSYDHTQAFNEQGYVDEMNENIIFGLRDVETITNSLGFNYLFNNRMGISFRSRHYWRNVDYGDFYSLNNDGRLASYIYTENANKNFNAFSIDMSYTWNFAPGSELSIMWKDQVYLENHEAQKNYLNEFLNLFEQSQINSVSLKVLYYIDYLYFQKKI